MRSPRRHPACAARRLAAVLVAVIVCGTPGCGAPIGVKRISVHDEHLQLTRNALTADEPSDIAQIILRRYNLVERYDADAPAALARLREVVVSRDGGNDELYALAELSYLYATRAKSRPHALAAALYAYAFLFPDDVAERPQGMDPRYRWACDLYAEGLTYALQKPGERTVRPEGGAYPVPFGTLAVDFDPGDLFLGSRMLTDLVPVSEYAVYGLRNRYRQPGIGISLAAKTIAVGEASATDKLFADQVRVPATAVLLLEHPRQQIADSALHGRLRIYAATDRENVRIDGAELPLEIDRSATVALTLTETEFWKRELGSFLGQATGLRKKTRLIAYEPYRPGRIPVVFVHGTNSSAGRWADMVNDLQNDPRIRRRYQFWFFTYDSGNPIAYSAMLLRRDLRDAVASFDPDGRDPCLREMVVIGHSQGGLLTKMTVIHSGDAFWQNASEMPFDEVRMSDTSRALLREALFVEPLPFVSRVVFIATPHRGSYLAGPQLVRRLAAKLISMPREITALGTDLLAVRDPMKRIVSLERLPTSIDNMSAGNPFIRTLAAIPIAPGVSAHSIIPVQDAEGPLEDGRDGVVAYRSAHIDGVVSERVVRPCSHSTQSNPETVDEVHRILLLHAKAHKCAAAPSTRSGTAGGAMDSPSVIAADMLSARESIAGGGW
jgi:pimeloyl-ACP methyl ester carboxylesterase